MKKAVLALMAVIMLVGLMAKAEDAKSKYEVSTQEGDTWVLLPTEMIGQLQRVYKSNLTDTDKLTMGRALFFVEGTLNAYKETYCQAVGKVYANVNNTPEKMAQKCQDVMQSRSVIEDIDDGGQTTEELRLSISGYLKLLMLM